MTLTAQLTAQQDVNGAPITLRGLIIGTTDADFSAYNYLCLGVTADSTPPPTHADFTWVENTGINGSGGVSWDSYQLVLTYRRQNGIEIATGFRTTGLAFQLLNSNFVVGRRVWVAAFENTSGSTEPLAISAPYVIR